MIKIIITLSLILILSASGIAETIEMGSGTSSAGNLRPQSDTNNTVSIDGAENVEGAEKEEKELPRSGLLATVVTSNSPRGINTRSQWGADDLFGESEGGPPVGASVRKSGRDWEVELKNNTKKDTYSIKVDIIQNGPNGSILSKRRASHTLSPGMARTVKVTGSTRTEAVNVELVDQRKIGK